MITHCLRLQVFQGVYLNAQVAIKVLNIDYDDAAGVGWQTVSDNVQYFNSCM
jgi:hypothetical protein